MISTGEGFVMRHHSGRFLVLHYNYPCIPGTACHDPGRETELSYSLTGNALDATLIYTREWWLTRWLDHHPAWRSTIDQFEVMPGPGCACCGDRGGTMWGEGEQFRCTKHKDRNPCAIEGCRCTTDRAGREMRSDQFLCQKHWRPLTTAEERRVYSRIWRQAKSRERKFGAGYAWSMREVRRLERIWRRIVLKARARAAGDLDMDEINKMFGWEE